MSQLRFGVLGPLEVVRPDGPVDLGAPKHRALLGILLLTPGRVVSVDRLVDGLWHGAPPASATTTLQAYVSHLRRALEPERAAGTAAAVLVTRPPGYLLDIADEQVDGRRFELLVRDAEAATAARRVRQATELLTEALGLFRGQPFADFAFDEWATREAARLAELQLTAQEQLLDLELQRGRHAAVIGDVERLVKEHPTRERLRELLMLALYRSGRQAEALRAYQDAREVLVEELGIDPGPGLRALEDRILAQDPGLDWQPLDGDEPEPVGSERAGPLGPPATVTVANPGAVAPGIPAVALPSVAGFVGRGVERARLVGLVHSAAAGGLRLALVSGEPGIGKTRLCEELADAGRAQGSVVVWARGYEGDGAPAFWPWVQVLRVLATELAPDLLVETLGSEAADIARVVPEYSRFAGSDDGAALDAEAARFRFFDAVTSFLRRVSAHRTLLLVLDDLHWADQSSLRLLEFCLTALQDVPAVFVGTYRDSEARQPPLAATLATLARQPGLERVALRGLSVGEVTDYIAGVVGELPDAGLVESVHDRTGGNPFFVAEIVRLLRQEGRLGTAGPVAAPIPEGVRDVIRTRLARLPADATPVLTAAAIVGREFDLSLVARVCGQDDDHVLDLVEAAWMMGIVDEVSDGSGRFKFAHELVRETLCDDLPTLRRVRLHRAVADAIEGIYGEQHPDHLAECAHHYAEAAPGGDPLKAVLYGQKAADRLASQLAYEDAIVIYERAIALVDTYDVGSPATRIDLLIGLGWSLRASGRLVEARDLLRRAADRAEQAHEPERLGRAVLGFGGGTFWDWWQEFGVADNDLIGHLEHALEQLPPGDSVLRCELLSRLAVELYFVCPRPRRAELTCDAIEMARRLDEPAALCAALAGRHAALWSPANHGERLELSEELVEVAQRSGLRHSELVGRHFRMIDQLESGNRDAVELDVVAAEELATTLGQHSFRVQLMWFRVMRAALDGQFDESERLAHEAFEANRSSSESASWMALGAALYHVRREQGRHGELEPLLRDAVAAQPHVGVSWRVALALLLAEHGRPDEARELVDELLRADHAELPGGMLGGITIIQLAEVCIVGKFVDGAATLYPAVCEYPVDVVVLGTGHLCFGPIDLARGNLAWVLGRLDEAVAHLRRAIEVAHRMRSRPFVARTQARLAMALAERAGPGDLDEARAVAAAAVTDADGLGMPLVAAEARSVLDAP